MDAQFVLIDACPLCMRPFRDLVVSYLAQTTLDLIAPKWSTRILNDTRGLILQGGGREASAAYSSVGLLEDDEAALISAGAINLARNEAVRVGLLPTLGALNLQAETLVVEALAGECSTIVTCASRTFERMPAAFDIDVSGPDEWLVNLFRGSAGCGGPIVELLYDQALTMGLDVRRLIEVFEKNCRLTGFSQLVKKCIDGRFN